MYMHDAWPSLICALTLASSTDTLTAHLEDTDTMDHVPEMQPSVQRWQEYVNEVETSIVASTIKYQPTYIYFFLFCVS